MKEKRKLKNWVKIALLLLPEAIIICQLFFIGSKISKITETNINQGIKIEMRCDNE